MHPTRARLSATWAAPAGTRTCPPLMNTHIQKQAVLPGQMVPNMGDHASPAARHSGDRRRAPIAAEAKPHLQCAQMDVSGHAHAHAYALRTQHASRSHAQAFCSHYVSCCSQAHVFHTQHAPGALVLLGSAMTRATTKPRPNRNRQGQEQPRQQKKQVPCPLLQKVRLS